MVSKLSDVVYRLQHVQARRKRPVVHFNRLKPCSPSVRLSLQETQPEQVVRHSPPARALPIGGGVELLEDDVEPRRIIRYQTHRSPPRNQLAQEEPSGSAAADELSTSRGIPPADEAPTSVSRSPSPQPSNHSPPTHRYPQRHRTAPDRLYARVTH